MVGEGLGLSMMAEMMIRGQLDGVRVLPVHPRRAVKLGMGLYPRRRYRWDRAAADVRAGVYRDAAQTRKKK